MASADGGVALCTGAQGEESATLDHEAVDDCCNTLDPTDMPSKAANPIQTSSSSQDLAGAENRSLEPAGSLSSGDASDARERARRLALLRQGRRGFSRHKVLSELAGELTRR